MPSRARCRGGRAGLTPPRCARPGLAAAGRRAGVGDAAGLGTSLGEPGGAPRPPGNRRNGIATCTQPPGQNGLVTSAGSATSGMLPLRETDPREVGDYRLLGRLGEGGQGVVFLALGPTGSRAAVKLLSPTTDPQVRSRFLKEVAAAQRVAGFCTAQVLDAGI